MILIRQAMPADAAGLAEVHVTAWQETYDGLMPESLIAAHSVASRSERWTRILAASTGPETSFTCVAEHDGTVIGFGSCGVQREERFRAEGYTGEILALYLLRAHQRRGIGTLLMRALAETLRDRGLPAATLWVLRDNLPARRFYEAAGGVVLGEKTDMRQDIGLPELCYGWSDLRPLWMTS